MTSPSDLIERLEEYFSQLRSLSQRDAEPFLDVIRDGGSVAFPRYEEAAKAALQDWPQLALYIRSTLEAGKLPPYPAIFTGAPEHAGLRVQGEFVTRPVYDFLLGMAAALTAKLEAAEAELSGNPVAWRDEHDCEWALSIAEATKRLRELYEEWPDGLEEIESSIKQFRARALAAESEREALRVENTRLRGDVRALQESALENIRECEQLRSEREAVVEPSDDEIMRSVINECDTLDITRVSEMRGREWHATTIFDGDAALLRVVKKAISTSGGEKEVMTDLELVKACADAIGIRLLPEYSDGHICARTPRNSWNGLMRSSDGEREYLFSADGAYDPLHDKAQCLSLAEAHPDFFEEVVTEWASMIRCGEQPDFNRMMCERVSRENK